MQPLSVDTFVSSLRQLPVLWRATPSRKILSSAAALGALAVVLRYAFSRRKGRKLIDLRRIARSLATGEGAGDHQKYDVVIVGGGTAGCVLASRLSEDPKVRVLLLEAGSSSLHNPLSRVPAMYPQFFHSEYDYDLYTVPQEHARMKRKFHPRGKMLGGCEHRPSFHYGSPSDFDQWAELQKGHDGASNYKDFSRYLRKFESFHPSEQHPLVDASLRGSRGPMLSGYFANCSAGTKRFLEACVKAGVSLNQDFNTIRGTLGVNTVLTFIDPRGRRVTTESAYLTPKVLARTNLTVATEVQVTRVIFQQVKGKTPRAVAVHFKDARGGAFEVKAKREIVLSAGAMHTPQLLMLSGIGPAAHLASHAIPVVADLPGVGSHLMDHLLVDYHFRDKTKSVLAGLSHDPRKHGKFDLLATLRRLALVVHYTLTGRGPLTTNVAEGLAFVRSSDSGLLARAGVKLSTPDVIEDSTTGPNAPDLELLFSPMAWLEHTCGAYPEGYHFGLHTILLRPTSTGTIRLNSADPSDPPLIDPQYLSTEHDVEVLVRGARLLANILHKPPLVDMLDPSGSTDTTGLLNHDLASMSDAELEALIRDRVETIYHPTCTARMAPRADDGVVDPFLRVYGVDGLRVCDASIFPTITSGHTVSPTIAVAEKAAEMILEAIHA
ncbi:GMC oxidoreductase [Fomitopsis serialis]|uniref:GMC oxidoreductase n=1 Tax=Fomitopsis serialis TaxID=139415 RepID=UPI002008CE00|nr:GMC oxidoreductase [Neoantrodia serialis]KAH9921884.1 GMC oxidoreductase [Neoantrodia serialis]